MKHLGILAAVLLLTGCDSVEEIKEERDARRASAYEQAKIADATQEPERVSITPDGRAVMRLTITATPDMLAYGCDSSWCHPHYVYYVGSAVTVNTEVREGKTSRNTVNVTITEPMSLLDAKIRVDQMLKEDQARQLKELREKDEH